MGSGVLGSATMERRSREAARVSQEAMEALKEDIVVWVGRAAGLFVGWVVCFTED